MALTADQIKEVAGSYMRENTEHSAASKKDILASVASIDKLIDTALAGATRDVGTKHSSNQQAHLLDLVMQKRRRA